MSIDEITEKTTIEFPIPIGREHAENLLCYISSHLPGNVSSKVEYFINYLYDPGSGTLEDKGTLKLVATINDSKEPMAFDTFVSEPYPEETSFISKVAFQRIPAWELSDYRKEVKGLWEDTRRVVLDYFREVLNISEKEE